VKQRSGLTVFKPGVYWDDEARERYRTEGSVLFKARGIDARGFAKHLDAIDQAFEVFIDEQRPSARGEWPRMTYRSDFAMTTARQALQRHAWHLAGQVAQAKQIQSADPEQDQDGGFSRAKRTGAYFDARLGAIRTRPLEQADTQRASPLWRCRSAQP
jgi:hypothetical protein